MSGVPTPLLIDTDPGIDDFFTIVFALQSPEFEVVGLTTVGGNAPLHLATRNALRAVEATRRTDVPVAAGAARPLRGRFRYSPRFHGPSGLPARMPMPTVGPSAETAVDLMRRLAHDHADELTVLALGPLTNLARLAEQDLDAFRKIRKVVIMGGAVDVRGNTTPTAEFNFWNDAQAADTVLRSGLPVQLVPLDVCDQVTIPPEVATRNTTPSHHLLRGWFARDTSRTAFELYDPLAAAAALDPTLVENESTGITVVTDGGVEHGRTVRRTDRPPVDVALRVDADRARGLISDRVFSV